jgi:hypothetical protein
MASRYQNLPPGTKDGKMFRPSSEVCYRIRKAVSMGQLLSQRYTTTQGVRLDTIAGQVYNNATLWWVIAAASGIGWACQVPAGTALRIPTSVDDVYTIIGS